MSRCVGYKTRVLYQRRVHDRTHVSVLQSNHSADRADMGNTTDHIPLPNVQTAEW